MIECLYPEWPAPPGVRAAITTRAGGMSPPPWDSLNLAAHVGDDPGRVADQSAGVEPAVPLADGLRPVLDPLLQPTVPGREGRLPVPRHRRQQQVEPGPVAGGELDPLAAADPGRAAGGLGGTITQDITLTNDANWVLTSAVFIGGRADIGDPVPANGPTLTIEAGTRVIGTKAGRTALVISRGSRIIAEGQPHAPIVMTGENYEGTGASAGDWGGLVINGAAPLNTCDAPPCEAVGEGDSGAYGGDDPEDDSGVLRYVRVQFAGDKVTDEDELNGIALQGVGRGTVVDYVQVHRNADDGIEFFGGTVNAKHLILTDIQDDSVDWTQGWQGKIQFGLIKQIQDETVETDRGFELDNLEQNNDAAPRSGGVLANFTVLGKPGKLGMNPRRGTGGNFSNFIVTGFGTCLDIDDAATFAAAGTPGNLTGVLTFENTILNCGTNIVENDEAAADPWSSIAFFNGQPGNSLGNPNLDGVFPPANAAYLSGFRLDPEVYDDFFEDVDWIGAFRSRDSAWHYNWSEFLDD